VDKYLIRFCVLVVQYAKIMLQRESRYNIL